jgi:uroporphyrinogen-III decarboxylase
MFPEDWGTQDRLMIAPALWREVFAPEFRALAGAAHERGLFVIMHSCGKITDIIPDLIDCGIDCLQFDQPRLHGLDALARFAGRVSFWCPVDIQTTLQTRDAPRIAAEARELIDKLGRCGGGFIAGYYSSHEAIGLAPDVQTIACRAFVEHGTYR